MVFEKVCLFISGADAGGGANSNRSNPPDDFQVAQWDVIIMGLLMV